MATYTTNYNLEKPAQTDIYNVDVFNANADKIDAGLTDKAEKTMLAPVETTNSASRSYAKGEYFVYNNVLCCATTAIATGGTIAIGTNCSTAPVGGELKSLRDALSKLSPVGSYDNFWVSMNAGYQGKGTCTVPIPNFSDNYNVTITDAMSYNGSTGTQIKNKLTATPRSFGFVISSSDTAEVGKSIVIAFTITEKT